jgi:hypothetical protein
MASDTSIVRSQVFFTAQAAHYGVARSPRLIEKSHIDPLRRAIAEGAAARQADRLVTVGPYPPATLRDLFVRGYVAARRTGVAARGRPAPQAGPRQLDRSTPELRRMWGRHCGTLSERSLAAEQAFGPAGQAPQFLQARPPKSKYSQKSPQRQPRQPGRVDRLNRY